MNSLKRVPARDEKFLRYILALAISEKNASSDIKVGIARFRFRCIPAINRHKQEQLLLDADSTPVSRVQPIYECCTRDQSCTSQWFANLPWGKAGAAVSWSESFTLYS